MRTMLKSKIHRARVTQCNVGYEGSITIDKDLMEAADMLTYEKVDVLNINNSARFHTYVIEGERGSGEICLNGAAARLVAKGDIVIILSYHVVTENEVATATPRLVYVNSENRIVDIKGARDWTKDLLSTL
ncbi:MAG: aspartate 1-decarboxylase [Dehalococcoidia bacterium]|nr:aspartate 1-decarboxylase [Dehalococcoidia bacterium]